MTFRQWNKPSPFVKFAAADFALNFVIDGNWWWLVGALLSGALEAFAQPVRTDGGP